VAVVGQSPGVNEYHQGRPFIGDAGQQLRAWLEAVGFDADGDVMYTNVHTEFHPADHSYKPTVRECREGYERVITEIGAVPTVRAILLVGATASHLAFVGRMGEMHGREGVLNGTPIFACWHPSFWLRSRSYKKRAEIEGEVMAVLGRIVEVMSGKVKGVELPTPEYVEEVVVT
jgi:DNA polymerase